MANPRRTVAAVVGIALATGGAGWVIGAHVTSPADAVARHQPPPASLITVPVARKILTSTVVAQGTATYTGENPLTLTGLVGDGGTQLVTKAPSAGTTLRDGHLLMEVSGRPVFVLKGAVPMYRMLTPGAKGDDVRQLQAAMTGLGYGGTRSGVFDTSTANAVRRWYEHAGYAPQQTAAQPPAITVPSGEILFLPTLPVRLNTVTVKAGAPATGQIGTITDQSLVVQATVPSDDATLVHIGLPATLTMPDGAALHGTVSALGAGAAPPPTTAPDPSGAQPPPDTGTAGASTPLRLTAADPAVLTAYAGQAVRITIQVGSTRGAALVVPIAAVVTGPDGAARVQVQGSDGRLRDVPVGLGLTAQGLVAVTAQAGRLAEGDRVVVGTS